MHKYRGNNINRKGHRALSPIVRRTLIASSFSINPLRESGEGDTRFSIDIYRLRQM
jgi:hypothetical protein